MTDEELDRVLTGEEELLPSPRFHASVMAAVHREATTPPPIPFPWRRVWPAFLVAALAGAAGPPAFDALLPAAERFGAPWIAVTAFVTACSLLLSRRLAEERS